VQKVFVAPGNGGTAREAGLENVAISAIDKLAEFAHAEISTSPCGTGGAARRRHRRSVPLQRFADFRPDPACARLESSKQFAKEFMIRHGIPTAEFSSFDTASAAHAYIDAHGTPIVVKADGLAAGKGVIVATSADEALVRSRESSSSVHWALRAAAS